MDVGQQFTVREPFNITDGRGRVVSKFLAGSTYRVTMMNMATVAQAVELGQAAMGGPVKPTRATIGSQGTKVRGRVRTRGDK